MSRRDFFQLFCIFYLQLINRKCAKEKKHQYLTLYQNWNRTPVYFELAVSASYLIFHYFFFNFCQGILISITSRSDIAINQSFVKNTEGTYEQSIICREHRKNYFVSSIEIPSSRLNPLLWTGATHYSPDTTDETIGVVVMIVIIVIIGVIVIIEITWRDSKSRRNDCNHRHHRSYFDDPS